ncbi:MAG: hypothetical protein SFX72_04745 [Isosphaeraceae bacterium]|nr:hypothetical protein [Isosphaeraceae bacterium]
MKRAVGSFASSLVAVLIVASAAAAADPPPSRVFTVDAVALAAGETIAGKPEHRAEHEGFVYQFATPENLAAFRAHPERFAAADGGACGRMGPLSGVGDARRYTVHAGRLYFFASDGCLAGFIKNPSACIETDDPPLTASTERLRLGLERLDKVVAWAGGAERLRSLKSWREGFARTQTINGRKWKVTHDFAARFPDRFVERDGWDDSVYATVRGPRSAAMVGSKGVEPLGDDRIRAFDRKLARSLAVLLVAHARGGTNDRPEAPIVVADGEGELDGLEVEHLLIHHRGATSRFTIDRATGKPLRQEFRGRDGTASVLDITRIYTAEAVVDGVRLPTAYRVEAGGKTIESAARAVDRFEVDPALPDEWFAPAP